MNTGGSERLRIDASGNLLLNTSTARAGFFNSSANSPIVQLEGTTTNSTALSVVRNTADTAAPFLILGKTRGTAVGETTVVASADNVGIISFQGSDGTELVECARIVARVDGTPGANDMPGALVFQTTADGAASSTERMRITSAGDVSIGLAGTGDRTLLVQTNTSGSPYISLSAAGVDSGLIWFDRATSRLNVRSSNGGGVYLAASGTSWTSASDERKKDIIEPITNALNKIDVLRTVIGKYKTDKEDARRPFLIAQDVQAVFPEAVDSQNPEDLGVAYGDMIPLLVKAIQELNAKVDTQAARIAALESK
jgi:hypothetical protein